MLLSKIETNLNVPVYFANAYSSWQRGSNENANGLLREFFPKKTDLARVSDKEVNEALCLINHRPRKCLGWKTSSKLFHEHVSICIDNSSYENNLLFDIVLITKQNFINEKLFFIIPQGQIQFNKNHNF